MRQTIVLLDSRADSVRQSLIELSGRGMLHPVVLAGSDGRCTVLREGQLEDRDVFEFLAGLQLDLVRFIYLCLSGEPLSPGVADFVDRIQKQLQPGAINLDRYSIAVPMTEQVVNEGAFCPYWNYNLIVEPADMAGEPGFAQVQVDNESKQGVIGASVVCMLGALWKWLDDSPLDDNRIRQAVGNSGEYDDDGGGPRLRIIRLVTRIVDAGNVTMQAVARALSPGVQLPPPVGCSRHGDSRAYVGGIAKAMFDRSDPFAFGLVYREFVAEVPEPPPSFNPLEAIKFFFTEVGRALARMPVEFVDRKTTAVSKRIEEFVASRTFGSDSQIQISFEQETGDSQFLDPARRPVSVDDLPTGTQDSTFPSPQTWIGLANLSFAIVDANENHGVGKFKIPMWEGSPAVVTDFSVMAPSALLDGRAGGFQLEPRDLELLGLETDHVELRVFDSVGLKEIESRIEVQLRRATVGPQEKSKKGTSEAGKSTLTQEEIPHGEGEVNLLSKEVADDLKKLQSRLARWKQPVTTTFLWRIADGLAAQMKTATTDFEVAEAQLASALESISNASAEGTQSAKRFRKKALIVAAILLVSILGGLAGFLLLPVLSVVIGVGFFLLGLISGLSMIYRAAKQSVRDQYRAGSVVASFDQVFARRMHALVECHRLNSLYVQYLDWAEIIGAVILRPLGSVTVTSEAPWGSTSGALSLVSGVPVINESRSRSLTLSVMQHLVSRGWMTRSYLMRRDRVLSGYHDQFELAPGSVGSPEADHSLNQNALFVLPGDREGSELAVFPPRRTLHNAILEGAYTKQIRDEEVGRINARNLGKGQVTIVDHVRCEIPGLSEPPRSVKEFLEPILMWKQVPDFTAMLRPARAVSGVEVLSVVGASDAIGDGAVVPGHLLVPVRSLADRYTLAAFRLDISDSLRPTEVAAIRSSEPSVGESTESVRSDPDDSESELLG